MYFLKMVLICVFVFRTIDFFESADDIILIVNVSNAKLKTVCIQKHKDKQYSNKYDSELKTNVEKKYNSKKNENVENY